MSDLKVSLLEEEDEARWNELIVESELGCVFHRYEYLKTVENGLDLKPAHVVVKMGSNIVGGFPGFIEKVEKTPFRRLCSIPFGYGGPVVITGERKVLDLLFKEVRNLTRKEKFASHLVKAANLGYVRFGNYFAGQGYSALIQSCKFIIDIDKPYSEIERKFSKKKRHNLRKSRESALSVEEAELTTQNIHTYYDIYKRTMDRIGADPRPYKLFEEIGTNLKGWTKLIMARLDGKYIGGLLQLLGKKESTIYATIGCSEEEYFKYYPTELLHEFSIRWGNRNGYKHYDLGGTQALFNDGGFRYKEQFGGRVLPYLVWEKGYSRVRWGLFRVGRYFKEWLAHKFTH